MIKTDTKVCNKCGKELPATTEYFHRRKDVKSGLRAVCKECENEKSKQYRCANKEQFKKYNKQYIKENEYQLKEYKKQWYKENKEQVRKLHKQYYEKNKEQIKEQKRQYRGENQKQINQYFKKRRKIDMGFRIMDNCRRRINYAIKSKAKSVSTEKLIGCTVEYLLQHLENQFQEGMTWENYGEWHVDHIKPCALFDFTKQEQQRECFNYINLQPLWAEDNLSKGSNY